MSLDKSMLLLVEQGQIKEALDLLRVENIKKYLKEKFNLETILRKHFVSKLVFQNKCNLDYFTVLHLSYNLLLTQIILNWLKNYCFYWLN